MYLKLQEKHIIKTSATKNLNGFVENIAFIQNLYVSSWGFHNNMLEPPTCSLKWKENLL